MKKVVYLNELRKPDIENLDRLYEDLKIPKKFIENTYDGKDKVYALIPKTETRELEYRCEKCGAILVAKWEIIKTIMNTLKEVPYKYEFSGKYYSSFKRALSIYRWDSIKGCYIFSEKREDTALFSSDICKDAKKIEEQSEKICSPYINEYKQEAKKFANMKCCPICNEILIKKEPYIKTDIYTEIDDVDWVTEYKEWYRECLRYEGEKQVEKGRCFRLTLKASLEANEQMRRCDRYLQACDSFVATKSTKINITSDFLKNYIMNLINLEANIICMSKRLKELYLLQHENESDICYEQGLSVFGFAKEVEAKIKALNNLKQDKDEREKQPLSFETVGYPQEPVQPKMKKAFLFNKKRIAAINAQMESDYQSALKKYFNTTEECDRQTEKNKIDALNQKNSEIKNIVKRIDETAEELLKAQNELDIKRENLNNIPAPSIAKKKIIDDEIFVLEDNLKKTFRCRNELYSYNIVFKKYRNIITLSTFYEYLLSGRCNSLEGANGAYNLFENETRINSIITKLDEIETKLDEIKENQLTVYNKLNAIEKSLKSLNSTMNKAVSSLEAIAINTNNMSQYLENISNQSDVIAHNTAISAYYSRVNAELTNALGFMVALK